MPLAPGTEHKSRALRKVVHLLTRLLWPPMSFCTNTHNINKKNPTSLPALNRGIVCVCCYLTQLPDPGDGSLACVLAIHGVLFKKQENLVVLRVVAFGYQVHAYEPGVCKEENT